MAGLTKTYSGDLTASIVGKIWDVIKDIDDRNSQASDEVKQAAKRLKKDDPGAVQVQDKFLAEAVVDIFAPLDVKFLQTEGKVTGLSDKINSVAGGIVDTQKLIINQNQILEDKFDSILTAIGSKNDFIKEEDERAKYKQLSLDLAAGNDLSTTSKLLKNSRSGGGGFFWKLLFNKKVRRSLTKAILKKVLRRPRIYAKLAKRAIGRKLVKTAVGRTFERVAKPVLTRQVGKNLIIRALKSPVVQKALVKKLGKEGAEKLTLKLAGKAIPGANTAYGAVEGLVRGAMGDWKGMMLSFGSAIPYAGYAFSAVDLMRDIDPEAYTKHIEANGFPPSDANIAAFFQDALGVSPSQYETGTRIQPGGGYGGAVGALTPILSVVKKLGADTGFGVQINSEINSAGLSSVPTENISYKFDYGNVTSGAGIESKDATMKASDMFSQKPKGGGDEDDPEPDGNPVVNFIKETTKGLVESIGDALNSTVEATRDMIGSEAGDGILGPKSLGIKHRPGDGFIGPTININGSKFGVPNPFKWWGDNKEKKEETKEGAKGGPTIQPSSQRQVVGRVGNTGKSTAPHIHIQRFPPPRSYEKDHITQDHPVIDHIFVGGKPLSEWTMTSPAQPDRWGRPHYGPDFAGAGINNQPITFSDEIKFNPANLYQKSSGDEGNNILFEFNGEQFTIFHLNSGPEAPPKKKDADLSSIRSPNSGTLVVNNSEGINNNSANQISDASMNRKLRQKGRAKSPIVIISNNIAATTLSNSLRIGGKDNSSSFIEMYNLAKHLV